MSKLKGIKYTGSLTCDLSKVEHLLIDIPPSGMKGARGQQEGFEDVKKELASSMPAHGAAANIPGQVYERFLTGTAGLALLQDKEIELKKLLEIVTESRVALENDGEDDIGVMAKAAYDTADREKDPTLAAPFEKTIAYNSQIAEKGLATRKKNAEAKATEAEPKLPKQGE